MADQDPSATQPPGLPEHIKAHLPLAQENALRNQQLAMAAVGPDTDRLDAMVRSVLTPRVQPRARIIRIRHLASELSGMVSPFTACASGCSHCCNIDVSVPRSEAKLIARATGLPLREPQKTYRLQETDRPTHYGTPCTMLKDGRCSIYEHRPIACRTLVNMDSTDLLCRLIPGVEVPVTYLNTQHIRGTFVMLTQDDDFADIRDWFGE